MKNFLTLLASITIIFGGLIVLWVSTLKIPDLTAFQDRKVEQSTKLYDRTGKILLYDIHEDTKRTLVPLDKISQHVRDGVVSIEDAEFYSHIGIRPKSILRAVIANFIPGGLKQGGSTITQQVIKNTVLTTDKTITRKLKEWVLSIKLEKVLTKDKILETYLNETPWGGNIYGVEEASKTFFGKNALDVTLAEAAYLAAIPQAPTYYSPYGKNLEQLKNRQQMVLKNMLNLGYITQEEYASSSKQVVEFKKKNETNIKAPHFSLMVKQELIDRFGEQYLYDNGLIITTTLDVSMQEKMEEVIKNFSPKILSDFGASNTAMVALDPKNGDVFALVGSKDYFSKEIDGNYNIITAKRQPGSTMKPFVYATAFTKGYTPETVLFDVKTEFSSECTPDSKPKNPNNKSIKCYSPQNYDEVFEGPISMKYALAQSRNIPAVKTLYLAGINNSINLMNDMGLTSLNDPDRYGLTLVLGGGEVSPLELTSAYGVFANEGIRNEHRIITKIEDYQGNILYQAQDKSIKVLDENTSRQISDILSDEKIRSSSLVSLFKPIPRQVAVKTGTTNDFRDVWMMGYTPNIAIGAWAGKNDNSPMEKKVAGLVIAPLWAAFFSSIAEDLPNDRFKKPESIDPEIKPTLRGIWKGGESYFIDKFSEKLATEYTPNEAKQEIINPSIHSILHWVDKDNPLGPIPKDPNKDSQYQSWEYGVRKWFDEWKKNNPNFSENSNFSIPKEKDDIHTPENIPKIEFINQESSVEKNRSFEIRFEVEAEFKIRKNELYVNNVLISSGNNYSFSFIPRDLDLNDDFTVKIASYDEYLNKGEIEKTFRIK